MLDRAAKALTKVGYSILSFARLETQRSGKEPERGLRARAFFHLARWEIAASQIVSSSSDSKSLRL
jgi:hypothetical protein